MIKVGLVGLGRIADLHYPGYAGNPDAQVFAVCDVNEPVALQRKAEWGAARHYTDFARLLADPEIDAVEILTPTMLHPAMTIQALAAGKHVAVQKPMANTLADADRMIAAARKAGKVLKISDNYCFYPPALLAKRLIEAGEIGMPSNIRIKLLSGVGGWEVPAEAWAWRVSEGRQGRGLQTFDHGHHLWATAWFLLGEVEKVAAWIDTLDGIIDSPAAIMWKHAGRPLYGTCEYSHAVELTVPSDYYANDEWIEITGSRGVIVIHRCTGKICTGPAVSLFNGAWHTYAVAEDDWAEGFKGSTHNFIKAIQGREAPLLSGEQGRYILKFDLAIQRANRLRREVCLDELDATLPWAYALRQKARHTVARIDIAAILERLGLAADTAPYAQQAQALTAALLEKFDPAAVQDWQTIMGLRLLPDGTTPEMRFTITVHDGRAEIHAGALPDGAVFTITAPAGVWAAILLGKKRVETAFIQGKLKIDGKSDEALKLKAAFQL